MNNTQYAEHNSDGVVYLTAPNILTTHAFTTRMGGVSRGIYKSMNLGENRGDDPAAVAENYRRIKRALGIQGGLVFSKQVHGTFVKTVSGKDRREPYEPFLYEADGLITNEKGLPLIIFTADCVPVLLHDPVGGAAGAVHAGWRGAVGDICAEAVRKMTDEYGCDPENIRVAIGPSIGPCCFETGPEVPEAAEKLLGNSAEFSIPRGNGKFMVNLWEIVRETLVGAGVENENIAVCGECTMCSNEKFWSHRHTHGERGSQASIIML